MPDTLKILLLEDSLADAELVSRELDRARMHHELVRVETREDFLRALAEFAPDVILSDHTMPNYDGLTALRDCREKRRSVPFIFVTGTLGEERAVESLKQGASDYVIKGDLMRLPSAIERAIKEKQMRRAREAAEQRLRASEALFKSFAEQAPIGIMLTDATGKTTFCNERWGLIYGRGIDEIIGHGFQDMLHPDDRARVLDAFGEMLRDKQPYGLDYRLIRPDGETRWVSSSGAPRYDGEGKLSGFIGVLSDNTEQQLATQKIMRLTRIQEVLSGINSTIVRVKDREQLCRDASRIAVEKGKFCLAWTVLADGESGEIRASAWRASKLALESGLKESPPTRLDTACALGFAALGSGRPLLINDLVSTQQPVDRREALLRAEVASLAYLPLVLAGRPFGLLVLGSENPNFFTAEEMKLLDELTEDIAFALDHLAKEEKLNYLAYYDALSGLPNRTLFFDHLNIGILDAEREGRNLAALVLNIERFRHTNESFGESIGDALLKAVARRLTEWLGGLDRVGHLGGDSFGIFFPMDELSGLPSRIEHKLEEWARQPFHIQNHDIIAPLKAGVAFYPGDGKNAETVFLNADAALKQAKKSGEKILFYSQDFNARAAETLRLEHRLRQALDRRELVLHYQPKVNFANRRVASVEALIRWQDKERGLVPPNEFVPILEETGLIYEAGLWALQQAHDDYRRLRELLPQAPRIAVNVSALQLRRKSFHDEVLSVIGAAPGGDHGIELEITESLLMENIEDNVVKLKDIREHDVPIAIDDIGTGYSSLSYNARLPIDILKIDGSFVAKMLSSHDDLTIVSTIITLAHSLNLRVVAEGVETLEQAEKLRALKCDEAQGYLFCRPLPLDELVKRLAVEDGNVVLGE